MNTGEFGGWTFDWGNLGTALTHGPIGELAEEYGLEVCHTGGGCWSLAFNAGLGNENAGSVTLLINPWKEDVEFALPEGPDSPVIIGLHYDEADYVMPKETVDRLLALGFTGAHPTEFYWAPVALAHGLKQVRKIVGQSCKTPRTSEGGPDQQADAQGGNE